MSVADEHAVMLYVGTQQHAQETYAYARTVLNCATANPDGKPRALIIGGGIANFTDVAATFKGIIQVCRVVPPACSTSAGQRSTFLRTHDLHANANHRPSRSRRTTYGAPT